ncbi:hypothetical protein SGLAD_v1c08860 [Spiroplasma gladiatoris]|uniref:Uncharacterized protein n=1 Tax=Spiroplasma gladiatoris TaxID=2143 RepID=A0A4P7AI01_9MOLU|nr:hypothetical protein [Spiroplasma gladiatoris]QBQ08085.1 hypothetical protein SGLAD_v1c08860 [Spiroplasma gladiatoris]
MDAQLQNQHDVGELQNNNDIGNKIINQSQQNDFLAMDVIFVNQIFYVGKEKHYRILVRPTISVDAWSRLRSTRDNEKTFKIEKTEVNMAIDSDKGSESIKIEWPKNDRTEKNIIKSMMFKTSYSKLKEMSNVEFREVLIPTKSFENNNSLNISYSLKCSNTIGNFNNIANGHIRIDLRQYTSVDNKAILLHDFVYLSLKNDYDINFKKDVVLAKKLIEYETFDNNKRIDFDVKLKAKNYFFDRFDDNQKSLLGIELNRFLTNLKMGQNDNKIVEANYSINLENLSEYYDLKKPNPLIKTEYDKSYTLKTNVKTKLDFKKNKVIESDLGEEGIMKNTSLEKSFNFEWDINYGGLKINFYKNNTPYNLSDILVEVDDLSFETQRAYLINFDNFSFSELKFDDKNKEKILDFIEKNQEIII